MLHDFGGFQIKPRPRPNETAPNGRLGPAMGLRFLTALFFLSLG
ncbi:serine/threonine kinase [Cystobacter fuscus DSM 2262]|uniref:Serine/threonine kinase n=1 Tax=Cystobacter fuscus (strain ATCC 25194 / DSM 2262 / NBRC 100088 / M29) TaxID=1242864 RepID=S9PKC3_CYSF2|nr:serine/threonine kinase [Cystobacter fuscus DSM 2262]